MNTYLHCCKFCNIYVFLQILQLQMFLHHRHLRLLEEPQGYHMDEVVPLRHHHLQEEDLHLHLLQEALVVLLHLHLHAVAPLNHLVEMSHLHHLDQVLVAHHHHQLHPHHQPHQVLVPRLLSLHLQEMRLP